MAMRTRHQWLAVSGVCYAIRVMPRDTRTARDLHAFDGDGMVLCNPRDREAALRGETEGIATDDRSAVTCPACLKLLHQLVREERATGDAGDTDLEAKPHVSLPTGTAFVRVRAAASMVGAIREGDGLDPKLEQLQKRRLGTGRRKPDHGALRLAGQIFDCLRLSTVLSDTGLDDFDFVGVMPGGRNGQFIVEVACTDGSATFDPRAIEQALIEQRARIRAEVAHGVHRRKSPDLTFRVRPPGT
jgi:hypothetical protein